MATEGGEAGAHRAYSSHFNYENIFASRRRTPGASFFLVPLVSNYAITTDQDSRLFRCNVKSYLDVINGTWRLGLSRAIIEA